MFLDNLPVSYVIYTEEDKVKAIVGLELADQHWGLLPGDAAFGLLPVFHGVHNSFDELMEAFPKEEINKIVNDLSVELGSYVEDPTEIKAKALINKYNQLYNG